MRGATIRIARRESLHDLGEGQRKNTDSTYIWAKTNRMCRYVSSLPVTSSRRYVADHELRTVE